MSGHIRSLINSLDTRNHLKINTIFFSGQPGHPYLCINKLAPSVGPGTRSYSEEERVIANTTPLVTTVMKPTGNPGEANTAPRKTLRILCEMMSALCSIHHSSGFSTLVLQHQTITLVVHLIPTFIASDSSLVVSINGMPTILCQMTDFLAVGALGCTLSIMVIVALRARRFRSSVRFLLSRPYRISLNHILFLEKLLLILVVVIEFSFVLSLSFRISAEFLIHQVVGKLDSKIKSLGPFRHDISMTVIGKSTDILVDLLGLIKKALSAHQGQFLETLSVTSNIVSFDLQVL
uniref:Uncharacterized protein n=1 Tax=Tanacetum cinerariifolium TaxID=118510 RepID=A0A699HWI1_TANCI|nr:hypothetical protein [Tanacetum cinerariifolium]